MSPALKRFLMSIKHELTEEESAELFKMGALDEAEEYESLVANLRARGSIKSLQRFIMPTAADILSPKDIKGYSLARAIKSAAESATQNRGAIPGDLEGELSEALRKDLPHGFVKGFLVPFECLKTLNAASFTGGGALASASVMEPLEVLRNRSVVAQAGAQLLHNIKGKISWPRQATGATGQWLSEIGTIQDNSPQWDALQLMPHRLGAMTKFTRELLHLTGGQVEDWTRREVLGAVASAIDAGALSGIGGLQPLGIASSPWTQKVTFGGATTSAKLSEMERLIADANAPDEEICFIASPTVREAWRNISRGSSFLWDDNQRVLGRPAMATKNAQSNRVICGAFSHYSVATFGMLDIVVDPYTNAANGTVRVVVNAFADCGAIYPHSFCVSTDAGNQ